jgi:putative ABC transport system ATP-binding protein
MDLFRTTNAALGDIMNVLETKQLFKQYQLGEHIVHALKGVDFAVQEGEFVAIMGPSGSGKSTLMHLLGGLDQATKGEVILAGQNFSDLMDKQATLLRRHKVGFVFQFFNLIPTLTAEENVALPIMIDGKNPRDYQQQIEDVFSLVGLQDRRKHKPDQLSGGEQQRISLARALVTQPAILLADEPTGNLDSKNGTAIMELLRKSCDDLGQTTVVVTHDAKASAYADRVIFLRDGKVQKELLFQAEQPLANKVRAIIETLETLE